MEANSKNKMGTKAVFPLLMSMSLPPMLSMLIQALYNIVDSMFVAQISTEALTAVSLAFPIQSLIIACSVGIGVGVNSYISRKLGERDQAEANSAVLHGLILALIGSLSFMLIGTLIIPSFFHFFTNDALIYELSCSYTYICVLFCFGCFFHICIEKVFQATGKMIFPMAIQAIGALLNIVLDPILIFGWFGFPALGVKGAAYATVAAQIFAALLSVYILLVKKHDVRVDVKHFKFHMNTIKKILAVGIPNACMNALNSVLVIGLNTLLIQFSNAAVSVFGVYFKLQTFVFMPVSGLSQGAMPIMGYNYGSNDHKRLHSVLNYALLVAFCIMLAGFALFECFPNFLLQLFNANEEMLSIGIPALKIIAVSFIPATFGFVYPTLFQAIGKGFAALTIFLLRQCVITIPLAFIVAPIFGLYGVWVCFIIAETISAITAYFMFHSIAKKDHILSAIYTEHPAQ